MTARIKTVEDKQLSEFLKKIDRAKVYDKDVEDAKKKISDQVRYIFKKRSLRLDWMGEADKRLIGSPKSDVILFKVSTKNLQQQWDK